MDVMAAGMRHRHLMAVSILGGHAACILGVGVLPDRQGVHVGPEQNRRSAAVGEYPHHTSTADAGPDGEPGLLQVPGHPRSGTALLVGQFWMLVQILIEGLLAGLQRTIAGQYLIDDAHATVPGAQRIPGAQRVPGAQT